MTASEAFWLVTWAILWWHLARWLVRVVMVLVLISSIGKRKGANPPGK